MKTKFKKLPKSQIELEVVLEQQEFQGYWQAAYDLALSKVQLKGFRPGAAPKELADQAIDKDKVFEEAAEQAVRHSLDEVSKDNKWTLIDTPKVELLDNPNNPLELKYKAILTVFPDVKLGNYKKIAKQVLKEKKEPQLDEAEVEKSLQWLLNSRAKLTRVGREARKGDLVDIDVESEADSFKGDRFVLGEGRFMKGFEENIENHKEGDAVEFSLSAPEDYWSDKVRGKTINFKVKINGVFQRELPELNDEFAQSLGPNFKTADDLRANLKDGLKQEKENKEMERLRIKMLDEIIKSSDMNIPDIMIDKTVEGMVNDYRPVMEKIGKTEAELKEQLRDKAEKNVASNLVIFKIAETENLQPTEEEIGQIDDPKQYNYNYGIIQNRKVFQFLESQK